jgi:diacylglycerol kinase
MGNNGHNRKTSPARRFLDGFVNAGKGIRQAFIRETNIKVFVIIAALVVIAGIWMEISAIEWSILVIVIGLNLVAELFNTALEVLCDKITTKVDTKICAVKDISAAAVLVFTITAAVVGLIIFIPRFLTIL